MLKKAAIILLCAALLLLCYYDIIKANNAEVESETSNYLYETVYVSQHGKIHSNKRCSGMKYYKEMVYKSAVDAGYSLCKNCYG